MARMAPFSGDEKQQAHEVIGQLESLLRIEFSRR
jgi:hypothetical protein